MKNFPVVFRMKYMTVLVSLGMGTPFVNAEYSVNETCPFLIQTHRWLKEN